MPHHQTLTRCAVCGDELGQPLRWPVDDAGRWQPLCPVCWRRQIEVDQATAVAWASIEVRAHGYALDQRPEVYDAR